MSQENQSPLEQAQKLAQQQQENLRNAREGEQAQAQNHEVEEERVDTKTDVPGSIGKSGVASNPRIHPQRNLG